jgi:hypothetical protein
MKKSALLLAAVVFSGTSANAQERGLSRRQFNFWDNSLTVEIVADMPGQLQIVRGEPGKIDVAGRVPGGIPAFALGGREYDHLRLTALGGDHADFVVVVPEDAMVRVTLPDRHSHQVGSMQRGGNYTWGDSEKGSGVQESQPAALAGTTATREPVTAYSDVMAPRTLHVTPLNAVRTVSIRFEGESFTVGGNRYMSVQKGDPTNIEVRTGEQAQDLIVTVPLGTSAFTLKLGGKMAMQVAGAEIRVFCDPVTEQDLGAGRRWYTFAPDMGRLICR